MISVLYVDDEPNLLDIAKRFLERAGEFRVGTSISAQDALDSHSIQSYDAIIADYQMPGMDGIAFLKVVREKFGDIPFILFTGRGREEIVIEAINNGADFYLQKGGDPKSQFAELAHKLRQAVTRRQAERSLHDSERRLSDIIDFLPDAMFAIDRSGHVIAWNRAIEELTGVLHEDMLGKGDYEYAIPIYGKKRPILIDLIDEPDEKISQFYSNVYRSGTTLTAETDIPRPKGDRISILAKVCHLYNQAGEISGSIESIRDITGLKKAEETVSHAKKEWETIFRAIGHPALVLDADNRIIDANDAAIRATGMSLDLLKNKPCYEVFHGPDAVHPPEGCPFEKLKRTGSTETSEIEIEALNGFYHISCTPVYDDTGKLDKVIHIAMDITERRRNQDELRIAYEELKLSGQRIRESEASLSSIFRAAPIGIGLLSKRKLIEFNDRFCEMTGYSREELMGKSARIVYPSDEEFEFVGREKYDLIRKSGTGTVETRWKKKDGTIMDILLSSTLVDPADPAKGVTFTALDITDRKRAETALARSEERYRSLVDCSFDGIVIHQDGIVVFVNNTAARLLGSDDPAHFIGKAAIDIVHPDDRPRIADRIRQAAEKPQELLHEKFLRADGSSFDVDVAASPCTWHGKPAAYVTFRDISEQKRRERELRESEERYRSLVEICPDAIILHRDGKIMYMNPAALALIGASHPDEVTGKNLFSFIHPDSVDVLKKNIQKDLAGERTPLTQLTMLRLDGTSVIVEGRGTRTCIDGSPAVQVAIRDITERQTVEDTVRASEEKYRLIAENTTDSIWIFDMDLNLKYMSPSVKKIRGFTAEEAIHQSLEQMMTPKSRESVLQRFKEEMALEATGTADPGRTVSFESEEYCKDGSTILMENSAVLLRDADGRPTGILGISRDITERKRAEEALRESETRYRLLFENANDAIYLHEAPREGPIKIFAVNEAACRMLGYTREELLRMTVADIDVPEQREKIPAILDRLFSEGAAVFETEHLCKDGSRVPVLVSIRTFDLHGILMILSIVRDITERKRMETALRESEERYRHLFERAPFGIGMGTMDGRTLASNRSMEIITGFSKEELSILNIADMYVNPVDRAELLKTLKTAGAVVDYPALLKRKDGTEYNASLTIGIVNIAGESVLQTLVQDITERKRAEELLRKSEEKFRTIVDTTSEWIWEIDREGHHTYSNPAIASILGYQPEEIVSGDAFDLVHPEDRQRIRELLLSSIKERKGWHDLMIRWRHKDNSYRYLESNAIPVFDHNEDLIGFRGADRDVTRRKCAEKALAESEERYRSLVDSSFDGIAIHQDGVVVFVNNTAARLLGSDDPAYFIGKPAINIVHPDDRIRIADRIRQAPVKTQDLMQEKFLRVDGSSVDVDVATSPCTWQGKPAGYVTFRDISGQKRLEAALRDSEEYFRKIFENSAIGMTLALPDSRFLIVNPAWESMLGYTQEEFRKMSFKDITYPDDLPGDIEGVRALAAGTIPVYSTEKRYIRKDGSILWGALKVTRIRNQDGTVRHYLAQIEDITSRKKAEEALKENEERLALIMNGVPILISYMDPELRFVYLNKSHRELYGLPEKDLIGKSLKELLPEDIFLHALPYYRQVLAGREVCFENPSRDRNGHERMLNVRLVPHVHNGVVVGIFAALENITERKRAEEALRENQQMLAEAMDIANLVNWECDVETGIFTFNDQFYALYGTTAELEGGYQMAAETYARRFVHPDDLHIFSDEVQKALKTTDPEYMSEREHRIIRKDGKVRHIVVRIRITKDAEGRTVKTHGANQDITEQRKTEEALRQAHKKLTMLNSITRHDILNLLSVLRSYIELSKRGTSDPTNLEYIDKEDQTAQAIQSQIEFGRRYQDIGTQEPKWQNLPNIIGHVIRQLKPRGIEVNVAVTGVEVFADPMIEKVFYNLVENSLRHGEHVTSMSFSVQETRKGLVISYCDNGTGVAGEEKKKLFKRGFGKNTGLGLFLSKEILSITGMTITENGEPGKGVRFEITVPDSAWRKS